MARTKVDKTGHPRELSVEQLNAVDLLITGQTDREVAATVGVTRQTVCGWRLYDPWFRAELNRRRREVWSAALNQLRQLLPRALDRLDRELDDGQNGWRVALDLLKLAGVMTLRHLGDVGPEDAIGVIDAEAKARVTSIEARYGLSDYDRGQALHKLDELAAALPRETEGATHLALPAASEEQTSDGLPD